MELLQPLLRPFTPYIALRTFYQTAGRLEPWAAWVASVLIAVGLVYGLAVAPSDYQQGDGYRIIFVHVPAAWMSLFIYMCMASAGATALVWRLKIAEVVAVASAPIGASFTALCLVTGMLWGKPMWGAYWVWDARLTSELVLLFLYLGFIALHESIDDRRAAARAASVLAIIGVVNIPIIHFSVEWWNTLHQGASVSKLDAPSIHASMLLPLLATTAGFMVFFLAVLLRRCRCEILRREAGAPWVKSLATEPTT